MEGNGGSLKDGAEAFLMLILHGAQLFLQSRRVLTVLDLNEVNVTLENAEIFGSVLFGEGGSVGGGWRCCRSAPGLPQLPPATPKNLPTANLLFFVFAGMGATSAASRWLEVNLFLYEKRGLIPTAEMDALCAFLCSGRPCPSPEAGQTGGHEACGPPGSH